MLIKIAWRNIWRNRARSLVIVGAIAMGLWAGVFVMGFYTGIIDQRIADVIESEVSHVQFHHPEFRINYLPEHTIKESSTVLQQLENDYTVSAYSPRVIINSMINSPSSSTGVQVVGVDVALENELTNLSGKVVEGEYFEGINKNPILISSRLAKKLNIGVEKKVVLTFQDKNRELVSAAFRVVGFYKTINSMYDETFVFVRKSDVSNLLGIDDGVHEIAVMLTDIELVDDFVADARLNNPETVIEPWVELSPEMGIALSMMDSVLRIIIGIILLALMFGIINTMLMAVLERRKELGVLLAVGMNRKRVFGMILLETVFLAFTGALIGIGLGYVSVVHFGDAGIDLSAIGEGLEQFGYSTMIYPSLRWGQYVEITVMVFFMAVLASIVPAINALRLNPIEAIRKL